MEETGALASCLTFGLHGIATDAFQKYCTCSKERYPNGLVDC